MPQAPTSSASTMRNGRDDDATGHTGRLRSRRFRHSAHGQCRRSSSSSKRRVGAIGPGEQHPCRTFDVDRDRRIHVGRGSNLSTLRARAAGTIVSPPLLPGNNKRPDSGPRCSVGTQRGLLAWHKGESTPGRPKADARLVATKPQGSFVRWSLANRLQLPSWDSTWNIHPSLNCPVGRVAEAMAGDALIDALVEVVGPANVLIDADLRAGYETDWTGRFHGSARLRGAAGQHRRGRGVLRACSAAAGAAVPQGGNTGLVGGSVPRGGEVVLSLRRLDAIGPVDAEHGEVVVGAGAVLSAVRAGARAAGWDVGVDMASRDTATIGGMVSTNAGGVHVLRYGSMRNQVLGLEAVLADGTVVGRIPGLRKDNTGYDLAGLLTGSEGTLAVITRVHLALVAYLPDRVVALCAFDGFADTLTVSAALRKRLDSLVALEVFFADGLALVCEHTGLGLPFDRAYPAYLLIECAGRAGSAGLLVDELADVLSECPQVQATAVAVDSASRERLWAYRERHTEAINAAGIPHKLDVTLPFDQLVDFERAVRARLDAVAPHARVVCFGHLGDGNLHVNILGPPPDDFEVDDAVLGPGRGDGRQHQRGARHRHRQTRRIRTLGRLSRYRGDARDQTSPRSARDPQPRRTGRGHNLDAGDAGSSGPNRSTYEEDAFSLGDLGATQGERSGSMPCSTLRRSLGFSRRCLAAPAPFGRYRTSVFRGVPGAHQAAVAVDRTGGEIRAEMPTTATHPRTPFRPRRRRRGARRR